MSSMEQALLVAQRQATEVVRTKSFRNSTVITALIILAAIAAVTVIPAIFGDDDEIRIGALPAASAVAEALPAETGADAVEVVALADRAEAEAALEAEEVQAVLLGGPEVLVAESLDADLHARLQATASTAQLAADVGASPADVAASAEVTLRVEELHPVDPALAQRRRMTLFGVFLALGQVIGGAYMVVGGITEEKSSRVVEVVMAKTRPRVLLAGKLLGFGALNLLQLVVFFTVGLLGAAVSPDLTVPPGLLEASGMILLWFLLAYAIFAALFSIAGALTASQEDMQVKVQPAMYLLFAVLGGAAFAINRADHAVVTALSFLPVTAPALMPIRDAVVGVAVWQQVVAMALTLAGAATAVWVAGAVYTGGALKLRGKTTIREALRAAGS
jgi:ABC-2 type transport system permease protein